MKKFLVYFLALTLLLGNVNAAISEEMGMELQTEELQIQELPELEAERGSEVEIIIEDVPTEAPIEEPAETVTEESAEAPEETATEAAAEAEATPAPLATEEAEESAPEPTTEAEITQLPELETEQEEIPEASEAALSVFLSATAVENGAAKIVAFIEKNFDGK